MRYKEMFECLDESCKTVTVGHGYRMDGIRCPRCDGPVVPKPFTRVKKVSEDALYVRRKILEHCHKHCFDMTAEKIETVLEIYKSKKVSKMTIKVDALNLDKVKQTGEVLRDVVDDKRVPAAVREEIMDKVNNILESAADD